MNHGRIAKALFTPCVAAVMVFIGTSDAHWPLWAAWILIWTVSVLPAIPIVLIRRKPHVRIAFWCLIGLWVVRVGTVALSPGNLTHNASEEGLSAFLTVAVIALYWVMLGDLPRKAEEAAGQVTHVIHHHVLHGPGTVLPPGAESYPGMVTPAAPQSIQGRVLAAIEGPKARAESVVRAVRKVRRLP